MSDYRPLTPHPRIAGVDEAGRGPLAGPLVVAAVVLDPKRFPAGLNDSKQLSARQRERLFEQIEAEALERHVVVIEATEIDRLNIFQATLEGMRRAVAGLPTRPERVLVDGNRIPERLPCPAQALVKGDALEPAISAASILAKVTRDRLMAELHQHYPAYGFDRHQGYPTAEHARVLRELGPTPQHRRSYAPVRAALAAQQGFALEG